MTVKKRVSSTKAKMSQVFNQARESLKILETLEKETLAKAKTFVKIPKAADRANMTRATNDKILASLRKLGVASSTELKALQDKVERLEQQIGLLSGSSNARETNATQSIPRG